MADASLQMALDAVRGKLLKTLDGVTERQARWAPAGLTNTILWHAGHSYVVVEHLVQRAAGGVPVVPDGWFEVFSWESRPANVAPGSWPSLAEVMGALKDQHLRLKGVIAGLDPARLDSEVQQSTPRALIFHGLLDEARHTGEVLLLGKLQRHTHN